jgi:hypothetical protein
VHIGYGPEGLIDNVGDESGAVELRVKDDLERQDSSLPFTVKA